MDIGNRISALREHNNLTITELAKRSEISRVYLSDIERNIKIPTLPTLKKICTALNVSFSHFFSERVQQNELSPDLKELIELATHLSLTQIEALKTVARAIKEGK